MIVDRSELPEEFDVAYIDADLLKYSAGFAAEKTVYHLYDDENEFVHTFTDAKSCKNYLEELEEFFGQSVEGYRRESEKIIGEEEHAVKACDTIIRFMKDRVKAKKYKFYLSGKNNFRNSVATLHKYGLNRESVAKPHWIESVVKHLKSEYEATVTDGVEGDDQIGVALTVGNKKGLKVIHLGCDKDVKKGIAGYHFDFKADEFLNTSKEEARLFNYCQGLAGDSTDGFYGIPGIGLKKAEKILEGCTTEEEMYEASIEAYRKYFGDIHEYESWDGKQMKKTYEELFIENMTLGWIMKEKGKIYKAPVSKARQFKESS